MRVDRLDDRPADLVDGDMIAQERPAVAAADVEAHQHLSVLARCAGRVQLDVSVVTAAIDVGLAGRHGIGSAWTLRTCAALPARITHRQALRSLGATRWPWSRIGSGHRTFVAQPQRSKTRISAALLSS